MLKDVNTTLGQVQPGDVMYKGTVRSVTVPRPTRSGRMLMTILFDSGEVWTVEPDTETNLKRPE